MKINKRFAQEFIILVVILVGTTVGLFFIYNALIQEWSKKISVEERLDQAVINEKNEIYFLDYSEKQYTIMKTDEKGDISDYTVRNSYSNSRKEICINEENQLIVGYSENDYLIADIHLNDDGGINQLVMDFNDGKMDDFTIDSQGDYVVIGMANISGFDRPSLIKYHEESIVWSANVTGGSDDINARVITDSENSIYLLYYKAEKYSHGDTEGLIIEKYKSTGGKVASKELKPADLEDNNYYLYDLVIDTYDHLFYYVKQAYSGDIIIYQIDEDLGEEHIGRIDEINQINQNYAISVSNQNELCFSTRHQIVVIDTEAKQIKYTESWRGIDLWCTVLDSDGDLYIAGSVNGFGIEKGNYLIKNPHEGRFFWLYGLILGLSILNPAISLLLVRGVNKWKEIREIEQTEIRDNAKEIRFLRRLSPQQKHILLLYKKLKNISIWEEEIVNMCNLDDDTVLKKMRSLGVLKSEKVENKKKVYTLTEIGEVLVELLKKNIEI